MRMEIRAALADRRLVGRSMQDQDGQGDVTE
jgi:hypothetical protein